MKFFANDRDKWPKGSRIQIVKLDDRATWSSVGGTLRTDAEGLVGTLINYKQIRVEKDFTYSSKYSRGNVIPKGQIASNLDYFYYIDLNDPDENY